MINFKKIPAIQVMKGTMSQNLKFQLRNGMWKRNMPGSLQAILPCIVGELAGGGSVAIPVGDSDM